MTHPDVRWPAARVITSFLVLAALAAATLSPAGAQDLDELRRRREEVRQERVDAAKQVDAAQADFDVLLEALEAIEENVTAQEARVRSAEQAVAAAQSQVLATDDRIESVLDEQRRIQDRIKDLAVEMYLGRGASGTTADVLLGSSDPLEAARRQVLLDARIGNNRDLSDELRRVNDDLVLLREEREVAVVVANDKQVMLEEELAALERARAEQVALVGEAELRLERMQSEAAAFEAQEHEISTQIREREAEIAAALARAIARQQSSGGGGGGGSLPTAGSGETAIAGGIRIHVSIAGNVQSLVAAAAADGISLGGGGWRSSDSQVQLRRSHCGTSDYAIYEMPSRDCRPPTARPGASMHERGLAIDFTCGGQLITSRGSACFQWLNNNAAGYGLHNLPSEPWHWSTNGS